MAEAVRNQRSANVTVRNYRADGTPFINRLAITPLRDENGRLMYFLGVQLRVDESGRNDANTGLDPKLDTSLREIQHRVKNHLAMVVGMIRLQAKGGASDQFASLSRRVEALQLLYEEVNSGGENTNKEHVSLGAYLSRVANAVAHLDGRRGVRVNIDADRRMAPFEPATRLGLIVSEVMTNALQHGFEGRDAGLVDVRFKELSDGVLRISVADDGIGIPAGSDWPNAGGLGARIVRELVQGLHAKLVVQRSLAGTAVTIDVPEWVLSVE